MKSIKSLLICSIILMIPLKAICEQGKVAKESKRPATINLRNDFGLGAAFGLISANQPSTLISLKFWVNPVFGLQLLSGFCFEKTSEQKTINGNNYQIYIENDEYTIGGRANFNLLRRDYLNFYTFAGGGGIILRSSDEYRSASGFYIQGGGGVEWFIPWVKRLGIDMEIGIDFRSLGDSVQLGNAQNLIGFGGFHYYF